MGILKLAQPRSRRQVQESDFKILLVEISLHFAEPYLIAEWNCPNTECRKMAKANRWAAFPGNPPEPLTC